jgi:hypothetical protein
VIEAKKTHRVVNEPQISGRYLADYMAATDVARRTILMGCKFRPIARVIQHAEAKLHIGKFLRDGLGTEFLTGEATKLRERLADGDFDRDLLDHNADYLDRFAEIQPSLSLPAADRIAPGKCPAISIEGVKVTADVLMRLRRTTTSNKLRVGVAAIRYAKNKVLGSAVAEWQSAFLFGYVQYLDEQEGSEPEHKLCITIDGFSGSSTSAPTNSATRIKQMGAACAGISERWDNIQPPAKAVL